VTALRTRAGHSSAIMSGMHSMLSQGIMCDVAIVAGGKEFEAHKLVLAAGSEFFQNRFSAQHGYVPGNKAAGKERVSLSFDFLLPETFALVLESLYTGRIKVTERTVSGATRLATQLGIRPLRRRLIAYLCQIARTENVEEIQSLGKELQSQELADAASAVILRKSGAPAPPLAPATGSGGSGSSAAYPVSASVPETKSAPLAAVPVPAHRNLSPAPSADSNGGDDLIKSCAALRPGSIGPTPTEASKCPWTKEEDKMVMELVRRHGTAACVVGELVRCGCVGDTVHHSCLCMRVLRASVRLSRSRHSLPLVLSLSLSSPSPGIPCRAPMLAIRLPLALAQG
jgi:hypothetical protein